MTKNAQQALKYLLQGFNNNVRFCLICNYISRIDESLQNEFMRIRFNQLPEPAIIQFLSSICAKEGVVLPADKLRSIQRLFKSDIRSMINYIQSNQFSEKEVVNDAIWDVLTLLIKDNCPAARNQIYKISAEYNIEIKNIIKDYLNYIIHYKQDAVTQAFLQFTEFIMHLNEPPIDYIVNYTVLKLHALFTSTTS
jgi:replication factor C subunit 3/5